MSENNLKLECSDQFGLNSLFTTIDRHNHRGGLVNVNFYLYKKIDFFLSDSTCMNGNYSKIPQL